MKKLFSWAAPLLVIGVIVLAMVVISNVTGLHLSVDKKSLHGARLAGTFELFSTVEHVDLPKNKNGVDPGAVRRFFQIGQQLSCRCVLRFQPSCDAGPCGGDLSVWRAGRWSHKVPFTYLGNGRYRWSAPSDSCGCYAGHGIGATIGSQLEVKVAATNQVGGHSEVFEFQGHQDSEWRLASKHQGFPHQWRVSAAVDAAATDF
jgi:hypothetical protein